MTNLIRNLRSGRASTLALAAIITWASGGLVACSDTTGVPATRAVPSPSAMAPAPTPQRGIRGATLRSQRRVGDTTVTVFTVDNSGSKSLFRIGNQSYILFPLGAASICDPATSGYGSGLWDTPCQPVSGSIQITAKSWVNAAGGVSTDFSPELRFVPGVQYGVTVFLHDLSPSITERIDYCSDGVCVDDAQVDGALVTNRDGSGFVYRVIKHFSGYNVVVN
jgi:hypothetical protein